MLLCIDFQPAYEEAFAHLIDPLRERIRRAVRSGEEIHFIYNDILSLEGEELGDSRGRLIDWCVQRDLPADRMKLIRKNFGWVSHHFRSGRERTVGVSILRYLMAEGLGQSSSVPKPCLERIVASSHDDFEGFWDCSPAAWEEMLSGAVAMPYLFEGGIMPWLKSLEGHVPEVLGGFRHRCLDEMCMMLEAHGISYRNNDALIYGLPEKAADPGDPSPGECEFISPSLFPIKGLAVA